MAGIPGFFLEEGACQKLAFPFPNSSFLTASSTGLPITRPHSTPNPPFIVSELGKLNRFFRGKILREGSVYREIRAGLRPSHSWSPLRLLASCRAMLPLNRAPFPPPTPHTPPWYNQGGEARGCSLAPPNPVPPAPRPQAWRDGSLGCKGIWGWEV